MDDAAPEAKLPARGWPNWVLSNHDRSRLASRLGAAQSRVAAMLLLTLRGTPTLYQGDELGMVDVCIPPDRVRDPWELNVPGLGLGRDPVRTPMPWSSAPYAGFSTTEPWLPLNPDWKAMNAAAQSHDPGSILAFYRALLQLRRRESALTRGAYRTYAATDSVLAFERRDGDQRLLIALNLGGAPQDLEAPPGEILLSTDPRRAGDIADGPSHLRPNEGVIARLR